MILPEPRIGTTLFHVTSLVLVALFVWFGMDVRRKAGTSRFVAPVWQFLKGSASSSVRVAAR